MALDTKGRVGMFVVVVGMALVVAGFSCLLVALTSGAMGNYMVLIIAGSICAGVGFISAMIAALYLTIRDHPDITDYDLVDKEKKKKPYFGVVPPMKKEDDKESVPPLSTTSKDHIYRMTLNLGSVDIRSKTMTSDTTPKEDTEALDPKGSEDEGGQDNDGFVTNQSLQPGLSEGTKQFKD